MYRQGCRYYKGAENENINQDSNGGTLRTGCNNNSKCRIKGETREQYKKTDKRTGVADSIYVDGRKT